MSSSKVISFKNAAKFVGSFEFNDFCKNQKFEVMNVTKFKEIIDEEFPPISFDKKEIEREHTTTLSDNNNSFFSHKEAQSNLREKIIKNFDEKIGKIAQHVTDNLLKSLKQMKQFFLKKYPKAQSEINKIMTIESSKIFDEFNESLMKIAKCCEYLLLRHPRTQANRKIELETLINNDLQFLKDLEVKHNLFQFAINGQNKITNVLDFDLKKFKFSEEKTRIDEIIAEITSDYNKFRDVMKNHSRIINEIYHKNILNHKMQFNEAFCLNESIIKDLVGVEITVQGLPTSTSSTSNLSKASGKREE
jgi:hypothetical protein